MRRSVKLYLLLSSLSITEEESVKLYLLLSSLSITGGRQVRRRVLSYTYYFLLYL